MTYHAALSALLEVEAQLEQPLEVVDRGAARLGGIGLGFGFGLGLGLEIRVRVIG